MAQGALKKNPSATANSHHKAKRNAPVLGLKKGARVIAPKKADLVKHKKINKVHGPSIPLYHRDGESRRNETKTVKSVLIRMVICLEIHIRPHSADGAEISGTSGSFGDFEGWEEEGE